MNRQQKIILWIVALPIIGQLIGWLQVAIQHDGWDVFFSRISKVWPFYFFALALSGMLIYAFKDKKQKR